MCRISYSNEFSKIGPSNILDCFKATCMASHTLAANLGSKEVSCIP